MAEEDREKNSSNTGIVKISPFFRNYGSTVAISQSPLLSTNHYAHRYRRRQQSTIANVKTDSAAMDRKQQSFNPFDWEVNLDDRDAKRPVSNTPSKSSELNYVALNSISEASNLLNEPEYSESWNAQNHSKHAVVTVLESLKFCDLIAALYLPIILTVFSSVFIVLFSQDTFDQCPTQSTSYSSKFLKNNCIVVKNVDDKLSTVSIHSSVHLYGYTRYILNFNVEVIALCTSPTSPSSATSGEPLYFDLFSYAKLAVMNTCNSLAISNSSMNQNFAEKNPYFHVNMPVSLLDWSDIYSAKSSWLNVTVPRSQLDHIFLSGVVIESTDELSTTYLRIISCVSMLAVIITVMGSIYYSYVTVYHAVNLRRIFKLTDTRIDVAESRLDRVRGVLDLILPEQYNAVCMLIFLAFWLNPYGSTIIASFYNTEESYTELRTQLAVAGILQLTSGFGLLSCFIWFCDGLGLDAVEDSTSGVSPSRDNQQNLLQNPFGEISVPSKSKSLSPTSLKFSSSYDNQPRGYYKETDEKFWMKRHSVRNKEDNHGKPSRWLSSTHVEYCSPLPPHHPCSISFMDFTIRQFLFLLLTWMICGIYWTVRLIPGDNWPQDRSLMNICDYVLGAVSCIWIFLLGRAFYRAQIRLNRIPYLKSRFRKILFRAITLQVYSFALAFLLLGYYYLSVREKIYDNFEFATVFQAVEFHFIWFERFFGGVLGALLPQFPVLFPLLVHPAITVAITSAVYTFALFLHPPLHELSLDTKFSESVENGSNTQERFSNIYQFFGIRRGYDSHCFVALENMAPQKSVYVHDVKKCRNYVKKLNLYYFHGQKSKMAKLYSKFMVSSQRAQDLFCLETACWLLEASYQAYTAAMSGYHTTSEDIESATTTNPFANTSSAAHDKLNDRLSLLGLELLSTFSSEETTTFGFISRSLPDVPDHGKAQAGSNRMVVSFRGSVAANILGTNMHIAQIHLPPLQRNRDFFVGLLRDDCSQQGKSNAEGLDIKVIDKSEVHDFEDDFEELEAKSYQYHDELSTDSSCPSSPIRLSGEVLLDTNSKGGIELPTVRSDDKTFHSSEYSSRSIDSNDSAIDSEARNTDALFPSATHQSSRKTTNENKADDDDGGVGESGKVCTSSVVRTCISWVSKVPVLRQNFPRVHSGFWHAYASIRESFLTTVVRHIYAHRRQQHLLGGTLAGVEDDTCQPLTIAFCGHSLGAAISLLAAYDLAENMQHIMEAFFVADHSDESVSTIEGYVKDINGAKGIHQTQLHRWQIPKIIVYTYGCPRVGNSQLARDILHKVGAVYRIAVNSDIVTMIPKLPFVYAHTGIPVALDADTPGSMIVNPTIIERSLLRKSTGTIMNHSLDVYRSCLVSCFESQELREYRRREYLSHSNRANSSRDDNIPEWLTGK